MGEVWRAKDLRLGREVAIKLLSPAILQSREVVSRFEREARALAALNHPRVAVLHGLEESDDTRFLVMELVDGETLERRLTRSLPLDDAIALVLQIAEALEAAHQKGIIHRDLKPSNVMIGPRGDVKLLDFGLSKLLHTAGPDDETAAHPGSQASTAAGVIMGTAPYMSPEQVSGLPVDARSDIWSFGCVLYEILAGKRAFGAKSSVTTFAEILEAAPNWSSLPAETPPALRKLLERCLRKDPYHRLQSIGDARIELEELSAGDVSTFPQPIHESPSARWKTLLPWGIAAVLALTLLALWLAPEPAAPPRQQSMRASILLPPGQKVTGRGRSYPLAISPDARRIAYVAVKGEQTQMHLHDLMSGESQPLPGTSGARFPFFSPDGEWIGFWSSGWLQKVSVRGGNPTRIASVPVLDFGAAWRADGTIVFAATTVLYRVEPEGTVTPIVADARLRYPSFLPDGRVLVTRSEKGRRTIEVIDIERGERRDIFSSSEQIRQALALRSGQLVWGAAGGVSAVAMDLRTLELSGSPRRIVEDVYEGTNSSAVYFSVAQNGTLVMVPGGTEHALMVVDRSGGATALDSRRAAYRYPSVSPDGRRVAVAIDADPDPSDIWIFDRDRSTWQRFTDSGHNLAPRWTPDGRAVAFTSFERGGEPVLKPLEGGGTRPLLSPDALRPHIQMLSSWAPDGESFVMLESHPRSKGDLWIVDRADGEARPLLVTPHDERDAVISPDGRWLAYTSDETGRHEIYVVSFPNAAGKVAISVEGGLEPKWSSDGRELFYRSGDRLMAVAVEAGEAFEVGEPKVLFDSAEGVRREMFAVVPREDRFLVLEYDPRATGDRFELIVDWAAAITPDA